MPAIARTIALAAVMLAGPAFVPSLPGLGGAAEAGRCPLINIGTAERPRLVKDPACGSPNAGISAFGNSLR